MDANKIEAILKDAFSPVFIQIKDDSERHLGHAGREKYGGGHYSIILVTDSFEGKTPLERHRAVYETLGTGMNKDIHALAIKVYTSEEWKMRKLL